ncbi:hypothetical protein BV22DRAFT_117226 [Leucogyrophana mollusca]|uniref:Uncharacterized protein n=1 Tax=Leucogyrophana mollusca TaxID=85980 RepID=A0ACB8BWQ6_9AGAM|nr:hypothetical protein BV22DRAFT_117226 [Leucogyrophana mollusca]
MIGERVVPVRVVDQTTKLPMELWHEVISYLPDKDVRNLFPVSRLFRRLCYGRAFSHLVVRESPHITEEALFESSIPYQISLLKETTRRLKELSSDPHLSGLRDTVRAWTHRGNPDFYPHLYRRGKITDDRIVKAFTVMVKAFATHLPTYPHLQSVTLHCLVVRDSTMKALQLTSSLHTLELVECDLRFSREWHLPLSCLAVSQITEEPRTGPSALPVAPTIVSPLRLRTLHLDDGQWTSHILSSLPTSGPYDHLTDLTILMQTWDNVALFDLLRACPQIRNLRFTRLFNVTSYRRLLPVNLVPHLESYDGPLHLADVFARSRWLITARLDLEETDRWGLTRTIYSPASAAAALTTFCQLTPNLRCLVISGLYATFDSDSLQVVRVTGDCLPQLSRLEISLRFPYLYGSSSKYEGTYPINWARIARPSTKSCATISQFIEAWSRRENPNTVQGIIFRIIRGEATLPPDLQEFVLCDEVNTHKKSHVDVEKLPTVLSALTRAYPKLRKIGFGGDRWIRTLGQSPGQWSWTRHRVVGKLSERAMDTLFL